MSNDFLVFCNGPFLITLIHMQYLLPRQCVIEHHQVINLNLSILSIHISVIPTNHYLTISLSVLPSIYICTTSCFRAIYVDFNPLSIVGSNVVQYSMMPASLWSPVCCKVSCWNIQGKPKAENLIF